MLPISEEIHKEKYRQEGETFEQAMTRVAQALKDGDEHFRKFRDILLDRRFLPAGRVQSAAGAARVVTPYNCFVSDTIPDSMDGIMDSAAKAATTLRLGGGIGYDFSTLRPHGDLIRSLDSSSSGPVSFMNIFDAMCQTISSAGHRRGAQMGVMRIDHPDIQEFINAKRNTNKLTGFNISIAVTDEFMQALDVGGSFDLVFGDRSYGSLDARNLWDEVMRSTWDWAEPGVLFIDTINKYNNLYYCESIAATNPCGEQPLPPNGACLLGSFNLVRYVFRDERGRRRLDLDALVRDIPEVVRAMDNVVDRATYPLEAQKQEAHSKRRMGLGLTGVANAIEALGCTYGSKRFIEHLDFVMKVLLNECYKASAALAAEKGAFKLYDSDKYLAGPFVQERLDPATVKLIAQHGIRNSHLTSIAPTGTISLTADNVSSGIEPVFAHSFERTIIRGSGEVTKETVEDYGVREFDVKGKTSDECSINDHLRVLLCASHNVDSAVSKTCNVGDDVTWDEFKDVYVKAYRGGAKGITTFRAAGKRMGILNAKPASTEEEGAACFYDPNTGTRSCEA